MMARLPILLALSASALSGPALAEQSGTYPIDHPAECRVAQHQIENNFLLPQVIRAIAVKRLNVLVLGAGSSVLPGPEGVQNAYPARLQAALAAALPGVAVTVTADVKSHRSAMEMVTLMPADLALAKPALVVWQTGTVDAIQGVDQEQFSQVLDQGISIIHSAGADVIFVNSQYSPRTESMIALGAYAENMRWVAAQQEIPLFDRYSIMKLWADLGTFNLFSATNKFDVAKRIHDCLGRLLAVLVLEATKPKEPLADSVR
jgi:GDSL-like Lipase/Acylhydrolase family